MMKIAIINHRAADGRQLAEMLQEALRRRSLAAEMLLAASEQYRQQPLPAQVKCAFVSVNSIREVEILRQIAYLNQGLALVIVSRSPEFGLEGHRLQISDYLLEPLYAPEVAQALDRCLMLPGPAGGPSVSMDEPGRCP